MAAEPRAGAFPPLSPLAGELIAGRFLVERFAGSGGMGAVFRARDLDAGTSVAIKVIGELRTRGEERFAREAALLSELSHPAIVRYIAHGVTAQGAPFLAMEWLDGDDLARTLERSRLTPGQTFALLRRVCEGLSAAHAHGVVHRDLKPSNLFVVGGDVSAAKVLDFGVARLLSGPHSLTRGGALLGTVGYMAPEQAMGHLDIDARADVFSLGCVLFECLAGRPAFSGIHDVAVLAKVLREEPPRLSELRPELGTGVDELLARMLAKDRNLRPRDARELLEPLARAEALLGGERAASFPVLKHLTESERRIVSIILARTQRGPATVGAGHAGEEIPQLFSLAQRFEAEPLPLQGGGLLLSLSGQGAATDQACRAASCALLLKRLRPELAIAVATGGLQTEGIAPVGDAIDRAAELLNEAQPGLALAIDELTLGLLDGRFDVQRTPSGPVLLGELDDVEVPRLLMGQATPCVGRDKELGLLEATFDECVADSVARLVLVTAPPGVGKSRLARAFLDRLRGREVARILVARAEPMSAGSPLALAQRMLRRAAGVSAADPELEQRTRLRDYLASLLQSERLEPSAAFLAELIGLGANGPASPLLRAARADPEVMRTQTRAALHAWLVVEAERRPLLVLLEDLHWADLPSVSCVEQSLRELAGRAILVVALGRPELREQFPKLAQLAGAQEIRLAGLTRRAAERLVRSVLPDEPDETVARIVERADGNAFYLEELTRRVAEGSGELPSTVLAMAQSRLERLELPARRVLRAASVFGNSCWRGGVRALVGDELDAAGWLETLREREILVRKREARFANEPEYEFRHALLRDAAYAMLTEQDRRVAHRIAGHWLEREGERDERVLADHFERGGAPEQAVVWLTRAALSALNAGDFDGAEALSRRGLALGARGELRGTLLLLEGYVAAIRTRVENELLVEAIERLPRASAHWWLALSTLIFAALSQGRSEQAVPYLQLAISTPPGRELTGPCGAALQALTAGMVISGRADLAWSMLDKFGHLHVEDPSCDPLFLAWRDLARCMVAATSPQGGSWQLERALGWGKSAVFAMRNLGSSYGLATGCFYLGYVSRIVGLYDEAEPLLREGLARAEQNRNELIVQYTKLILTLVLLRRGAFDEAFALLSGVEHSLDASIAQGALAMKAEAHYRRGELELARAGASFASSGPSAPYRRVAFSTLARTQLALAEPNAVLISVDRALADQASSTPEYEADLLASKVQALEALGSREQAEQTLASAVALVESVLAGFSDPALRTAFLTRIEGNARVMALHAARAPTSF